VFGISATSTIPALLTSPSPPVVAGGGGGGYQGGGGGAGGLIYAASYQVAPGQAYSVTVGAGGAGGDQGEIPAQFGVPGGSSSFGPDLVAVGGGGGEAYGSPHQPYRAPVSNGGSGGGAGYNNLPGNGTAGQGHDGGNSAGICTGGGGGAGGPGGDAFDTYPNYKGGAGGAGLTFSVTGTPVCYAGGGEGGATDEAGFGAVVTKGLGGWRGKYLTQPYT
jgi:hypothetical protein